MKESEVALQRLRGNNTDITKEAAEIKVKTKKNIQESDTCKFDKTVKNILIVLFSEIYGQSSRIQRRWFFRSLQSPILSCHYCKNFLIKI